MSNRRGHIIYIEKNSVIDNLIREIDNYFQSGNDEYCINESTLDLLRDRKNMLYFRFKIVKKYTVVHKDLDKIYLCKRI
jgi:hypothetical protein